MDRSRFPDGDGVFSKAPILNFNDDKLKFNANDVSNTNDHYGSASGFVPKFLLAKQKVSIRIPFSVDAMLFLL